MTDDISQDHDVRECAYEITAAGKRVLIVHGQGAYERNALYL